MRIVVNDEEVASTKVDVRILKDWELGPNIGLETLEVDDGDVRSVEAVADPPAITVDGIDGVITGHIHLYAAKISGGKSEQYGPSNGFFVNVLGRVINLSDNDFGLSNLSHGTWSQFRATIRADGLDAILNVERETFRESDALKAFKALLLALFNRARAENASRESDEWPNAGAILTGAWQAMPLRPLGSFVGERLLSSLALPSVFDTEGVEDAEAYAADWTGRSDSDPGSLISGVKNESLDVQAPLDHYRLSDRVLVLNDSHPFAREHSATHEESVLLRDMELASFLHGAYLLDAGIDLTLYEDARRYRDEVLRVFAALNRRGGAEVANLLANAVGDEKGLETAVGDALEYLGFAVTRLAEKGQPEGYADAPLAPGEKDEKRTYRFVYEAKSTTKDNGRVSNKEVGAGRIARHRKDWSADHALVVAPDYQLGALQKECAESKVTPMRAEDLAALVMSVSVRGSVALSTFRTLFECHDPDVARDWVANYVEAAGDASTVSIPEFLNAVEALGFARPDALTASVIAEKIRDTKESETQPTRTAVAALVQGLEVLLPQIVRIAGENVFISAPPDLIRVALREQVDRLPQKYRYGLDAELANADGAEGGEA